MPFRRFPAWQRWILAHTPKALLQQPFELFLALVCVLSGTTLLLGGPPPLSLANLLPWWIVKAWALELILGGVATMIGGLSARSAPLAHGLQLLGIASLVYAVAIFTVGGFRGVVAGAITIAFGLACLARAFTIVVAAKVAARVYGAEQDAP